MPVPGDAMSRIKLFSGAAIIAGLGFGAGYYCAADSPPDRVAPANAAAVPQEQTRLERQLADALAEIHRLRAGSDTGETPAEESPNLPLARPSAYAGLLEKLDTLPLSLIESQLEKYLGGDALTQIDDKRAFAKRLLEVALEDQEPPEEEDGPLSFDIQFSRSPMYGKQMISQDIAVSKFEPLFAHIVTADDLGEVILKWQDVGSGEILTFKKVHIGPGSQTYLSAVPMDGWQESVYRVSLNSMDASVDLMGASAYSIAEVYGEAEDSRGPNTEIINDLISMGQAVPKVKQ